MRRTLLGLVLILILPPGLPADPADLSEFRTVETAITTRISQAGGERAHAPGYLGISVERDKNGRLVVSQVAANSPAAKEGLQPGDVLIEVGTRLVTSTDALRNVLQTHAPGDVLALSARRGNQPVERTVTLAAASRPMQASGPRAVLGIQAARPKDDGLLIEQITAGSPAANAGLKPGDVLLQIDGISLLGSARLGMALAERRLGDWVRLTYRRGGKSYEIHVTLAADRTPGGPAPSWDSRTNSYWKKDVYRLAVVCIEFPDVLHNPHIRAEDWQEAIFSRDTYHKTSATGQPVHGSVRDYYHEQSCAALRVEGRVFSWVQVGKKRAEYAEGSLAANRTALLTETLDRLRTREGPDALKEFDGLCFLYAGERYPAGRGGLYWPHRSLMNYQGRRWSYFVCPEGGRKMTNISVFCHEFGHMLGLPDLYARPENPGSEGVGVWCAMSSQLGRGRPQHFCAWSKEQLGWLKPAVIDPSVKQKLILGPVEDSPKECFKVLIRPDGSEYLLLENRRKKGFDTNLPAEGLLIWHVVNNRPVLEESHGVAGPAGPRVFLGSVPYPSPANDSFTPYTTPSSRATLGGGLPVHITNIRRLPDGRITFFVGYEFV